MKILSRLKNGRIRSIIAALLVLVFFQVLLLFVPVKQETKIDAPTLLMKDSFTKEEYQAEREKWTTLLQKKSPTDVYNQFLQDNATRPFVTQHPWAHFFGQLLYEKMGDSAITVCDRSFAFGCFHGVAIKAIQTKGIGEVKALNKTCMNTKDPIMTVPCRHGIGHGLLEFLGTRLDRVDQALNACNTEYKETGEDRFLGCYSGVFMEYNNSRIEKKPKSEKELLFPCTDVASEFQDICYHRIVEWWEEVFERDYKKIGKICEEVKPFKNKYACFKGLGHVIVVAGKYDPNSIIKLCETVSSKEGIMICKQAAAQSVFLQTNSLDKAQNICKGLPKQEKEKCK